MALPRRPIRLSDHYRLGRTQAELDFVDAEVVGDTRLFVSPTAIRMMHSEWADHCVFLMQDFFEAGGHSLLATALLAAIQKECGVTVRLADFLKAPTISRMAAAITAGDQPVGGPFPSTNTVQVHSALRLEWHEQGIGLDHPAVGRRSGGRR